MRTPEQLEAPAHFQQQFIRVCHNDDWCESLALPGESLEQLCFRVPITRPTRKVCAQGHGGIEAMAGTHATAQSEIVAAKNAAKAIVIDNGQRLCVDAAALFRRW
jgi:hypothetical protein